MQPTIVLVHGAFAESASWDGVIDPLVSAGHPVIAAANPLRGVATDAAAVSDLVATIDGPVVLVAHSYGGAVITNVAADAGDIVGLVYVAAFAPEPGESAFTLAGMFPGSTLGEARAAGPARRRHDRPVHRPRPLPRAVLRGRPGRAGGAHGRHAAAGHAAGAGRALGRSSAVEASSLPGSCSASRIATSRPRSQHFMAERAGAHRTIEIPGASHAVCVAHPAATAHLILEAAALRVAA